MVLIKKMLLSVSIEEHRFRLFIVAPSFILMEARASMQAAIVNNVTIFLGLVDIKYYQPLKIYAFPLLSDYYNFKVYQLSILQTLMMLSSLPLSLLSTSYREGLPMEKPPARLSLPSATALLASSVRPNPL